MLPLRAPHARQKNQKKKERSTRDWRKSAGENKLGKQQQQQRMNDSQKEEEEELFSKGFWFSRFVFLLGVPGETRI